MRSELMSMLLLAGVIGPLTDIVARGYSGRIGIRTDTLRRARAAVVLLAMITLTGKTPVSYGTEVRSGASFMSDLGVSGNLDANMWVLVMICFEFTALLTLSEEVLLFCSMAI